MSQAEQIIYAVALRKWCERLKRRKPVEGNSPTLFEPAIPPPQPQENL